MTKAWITAQRRLIPYIWIRPSEWTAVLCLLNLTYFVTRHIGAFSEVTKLYLYYVSVKGSVKHGVTSTVMFNSTCGNGYRSDTGSSTAAIFINFEEHCGIYPKITPDLIHVTSGVAIDDEASKDVENDAIWLYAAGGNGYNSDTGSSIAAIVSTLRWAL